MSEQHVNCQPDWEAVARDRGVGEQRALAEVAEWRARAERAEAILADVVRLCPGCGCGFTPFAFDRGEVCEDCLATEATS